MKVSIPSGQISKAKHARPVNLSHKVQQGNLLTLGDGSLDQRQSHESLSMNYRTGGPPNSLGVAPSVSYGNLTTQRQ